jgi:phenylalanyl-tRNA synthetase alpha chain
MPEQKNLHANATAAILNATSLDALEAVRLEYFGKKGVITEILKSLGTATVEERQKNGPLLNAMKANILEALENKKEAFHQEALNEKLKTEVLDVTLPGRPELDGFLHPIQQTIEEVMAIFGAMGFAVKEGPHIEEDFYNFTALNIPLEHPARQTQDTFYVNDDRDGVPMVLRTHTSPVQIRTLLNEKPPIRIIAPGRTFRADYDMTHTPMFHQVEGLFIGDDVTMAHLKGCLVEFLETFFEVKDLPVRFRPSFFPFTEPSAEVDIGCTRKDGTFKIGAGNDWLEILGCGMVHPKVLENCKIDSTKYQGFAFGMGIERIAMLKYGIPDLRTFFESDLRWLRHYGFRFFDRPSPFNKARTEVAQ